MANPCFFSRFRVIIKDKTKKRTLTKKFSANNHQHLTTIEETYYVTQRSCFEGREI